MFKNTINFYIEKLLFQKDEEIHANFFPKNYYIIIKKIIIYKFLSL